MSVLLAFVLWGVFFLGIGWVSARIGRRVAAAKRRRFENRLELAKDDFAGLFQAQQGPIAVNIRGELESLFGRCEVARRLLPADSVVDVSELFRLSFDDLDWAEFLTKLEGRFGVRLPSRAARYVTIGELVGWCAKGKTLSSSDSVAEEMPPSAGGTEPGAEVDQSHR